MEERARSIFDPRACAAYQGSAERRTWRLSRRRLRGALCVASALLVGVVWCPASEHEGAFVVGASTPLRSFSSSGATSIRPVRGAATTRQGEGGSSAQVKVMLNEAEQEQLLQLGCTPEEVFEMRVELAEAVLRRSTRRPWGDGAMPDAWRDPVRVAAANISEGEGVDEGEGEGVRSSGADAQGDVSMQGVFIGTAVGALAFLGAFFLSVQLSTPPAPDLPEYTLRSSG
mmetsp:Transcript_55393/g.159276  ORF Transcript_55393/g.159276 Transcript_55393/m.159276 type:complete len:229 (-) Transcript_55393:47-733(-)